MDVTGHSEPAFDLTAELTAVMAGCFTYGTSQTILLLGINSYAQSQHLRTQAVAYSAIQLSINSSLFPDDAVAVELLCKELGKQVMSDVGNGEENFREFAEMLTPGHNVLLVVHEAENYAHKGHQRFLYSLLELVSSQPCGFLLVLQSPRLDFTERLEKRLKSRLNAKPYSCMQVPISEFKREVLTLCLNNPDTTWNETIQVFVQGKEFEHYYALGKPANWFQYIFRRAQVEFIRLKDQRQSLQFVLQEEASGLSQSYLKELVPYELAVLLAHAKVEKTQGFSKYDFAYSELRSHTKHGIITHSRRSFFRVSSRLLALGLLEKQTKHMSDETAVIHLQVDAQELFNLVIESKVKGFSLFASWLKSSV